MNDIVVVGSGFAGLWAALAAARRLDELAVPASAVTVTVLSAKPFHDIRVRNYEDDLSACRIPLADLLDPVGVAHVAAEVTAIDTDARTVTTAAGGIHRYDRLVLASGSHVHKPAVPGVRECAFDVDTYDGARALQDHLRRVAEAPPTPASGTVVVVGAGLTGLEIACELPARLRRLFAGTGVTPRVIVVDRHGVGSDMGPAARPVIQRALADNGVETRTEAGVAQISERGVTPVTGERLEAATVVWCAGMRASSLTEQLPVPRDPLGRLPVDDYLRVIGVPGVFAAGDVAAARMDDTHLSVMSCQHGRPMGRYAGYNVISDLFDEPMLPLRIPWYVTVVDLGPAGAVYTEGWDRALASTGAEAKATKRIINTHRIYPPLTGSRADLLAAAAPELQARP